MYDDLRHVHALFKKHFCDQCLCLKYVNTQTKHFKSVTHMYTTACYNFPKNLIHWRDSNPGLLFLRRIGSLKKNYPSERSLSDEKLCFLHSFHFWKEKKFYNFSWTWKICVRKSRKSFSGMKSVSKVFPEKKFSESLRKCQNASESFSSNDSGQWKCHGSDDVK
jgi:hypothetical protein